MAGIAIETRVVIAHRAVVGLRRLALMTIGAVTLSRRSQRMTNRTIYGITTGKCMVIAALVDNPLISRMTTFTAGDLRHCRCGEAMALLAIPAQRGNVVVLLTCRAFGPEAGRMATAAAIAWFQFGVTNLTVNGLLNPDHIMVLVKSITGTPWSFFWHTVGVGAIVMAELAVRFRHSCIVTRRMGDIGIGTVTSTARQDCGLRVRVVVPDA